MNNIKFDKHTGYFLKTPEKRLLKYINPSSFISDALEKNKPIEKNVLINFLQDELHDLLNSFLNGGFSNKGFILYPLVKDVSKENAGRVLRIMSIIKYLENKGIEFKNSKKSNYKNINSKNIAFLISDLYKDIENINKGQKTIKKDIKIRRFAESVYEKDLNYLKPVFDLKKFVKKKLSDDVLDFHLHGSMATRDYVKGFSDLDTLIIFNKGAIKPQNLIRLRNVLYKSRIFFYLIDPLQHHSHMIITDYDLNCYCQTYFPLELFKYSKSFTKNKILKFKVRGSKIENISKLFWFVNYFRELNLNKKKASSCYSAKFLLHAITLFPTLYLQAKGIHTYKKYSFDKIKKEFSDDLWGPIETATSIRKEWKPTKTLPLIKNIKTNPLLGYQINAKYWDITKKTLKKNKVDVSKLSEEMFHLSESVWDNIKKRLK